MKQKGNYREYKLLGKIITYLLLVFGTVYTLIPFLTIVITSFRTPQDSVRGPFTWPREWEIIENYFAAWKMGKFELYLFNSLYMMVLTVIGTLLVATLAGYSFAKFRYPGKNLIYYILLLSMMIPFQTIMLPLYFILKNIGLLNSLNGIILLSTATGLGFAVMMMRSFFISLPDSLLEAARLDGCNELGVLFRIVMPNTFPAWSSLIVFVAMGSWNNLLAPMIYIFTEEKYPIPYALYTFQSSHSTTYELLSAAMMISIIPLVIIYIIFQKNFQSNLMAGAVKG